MIIIPAIDLIDGQLVRLSKGDYNSKKAYGKNPVDMALAFEAAGLTHLHLVDLDGAKSGSPKNLGVLEAIASATSLEIDFGGGVKTTDALAAAFSAGASKVTCGSIAASDSRLVMEWLDKFGAGRLVLGADSRNGRIATVGWLETTGLDVFSFIGSYLERGLKRVVCTDISRDGMLAGPAFELYDKLIATYGRKIELVASGGVSSLADLEKLAGKGVFAAIVGKAIYEGNVSLKELKDFEEEHHAG